jgi:hypothetical protein
MRERVIASFSTIGKSNTVERRYNCKLATTARELTTKSLAKTIVRDDCKFQPNLQKQNIREENRQTIFRILLFFGKLITEP